MTTYISQPEGSMSCGAYSIAYYLWETKKSSCINDRSFVDGIYENIKFGPNELGLNEEYSSPDKMNDELSNNWQVSCSAYILKSSPLMKLAEGLDESASSVDVFAELKANPNKYAIIICSLTSCARALHYILIKYEANTLKMLNSLAIYGDGADNVTWKNFSVEPDGKLKIAGNSPYIYIGAGIMIN